MVRRLFVAVLLVAAFPSIVRPDPLCKVSGLVFADHNVNGQHDPDEPGLPGLWVSDGEQIVETDEGGRYDLNVSLETLRWVVITRPRGWRLTTPLYTVLDPEQHGGQEIACHFGLRRDPAANRDDFHFLMTGDSQFSSVGQAEWLRQEMAYINRIGQRNDAAFLCVLGDLTQSGRDEEFRWYWQAVAELTDLPLYNVFGGHDGLYDTSHPPGGIGNYIKYCGPTWYSWEYGPCHFVVSISESWFLTQAERQRHDQWLQTEVAKVPAEKYLVLLSHYPPANANMQAWLPNHRIACALYGHWHERGISQFRTGDAAGSVIPYLLTSPLRSAPDSGAFNAAVRLVHFSQGKIWTRTFIPGRLKPPQVPEPTPDAPPVRLGRLWPQVFAGELAPRVTSTVLKPPLEIAWRAPTGAQNSMFNSPIVYRGKVIVGVYDGEWHGDRPGGTVAAFDARSGREVWRTGHDSDVRFAPCARRGRLYTLSSLGTVYCLDANTGRIIWERRLYGEGDQAGGHRLCQSIPVIYRDMLLCAGDYGPLFVLDPDTGEITAQVAVSNHPRYAAPTGARGRAFFAARDVTSAVDLNALQVLWKTPTQGTRAVSTPCVAGDTVFVNGTTFYAFDARTGAVRWKHVQDLGSFGVLAAIAYDGLVYGGGRTFLAMNPDSGEVVWEFAHGEHGGVVEENEGQSLGAMSTPLIAGDLMWLGSDDGHLYALERKTGELVWRRYFGSPIKSSPAVSGNALYILDFDGNLYCLVSSAQ